MTTLIGVLIVAAVATSADALWYGLGVRHTMTAGLIHGALLLAAVGGVLGAASGRLVRGLPIGALAGIGGAVSYYAIVAVFDRRTYGSAIPAAWVLTWLYLAALDGRWLRAPARQSWGEVVIRGLLAAILGGVAFYLVINVLWGRPPEGGRNYLVQFFAWAFAWAPGLFALTVGGTGRAGPVGPSARWEAPKGSALSTLGSVPGDDGPVAEEDAITGAALLERIERGETPNILDVRSEGEFAAGHVPGAVNIPFMQITANLKHVPGSAADDLIVYCGHGPRAYIAAGALRRGGRSRIVFMTGHWAGWQAAGLRVER